jgi:acyl carrier protein
VAEYTGGNRKPPIGRPIANTQAYILDRHLQLVPIRVPGELHIGGVGLARGYLNSPDLTEEKFIPNPFSNDPDSRLYKTGDLCRYLPDGNIDFLGRFDHQVKVHGYRVELGEIEAAMEQSPAVQEVVVLAREDEPGDKRLVAYVVPNEAPSPTVSELRPQELRHFLKQKLPDYMVPSIFVMLDTLPLTPNGKVDRRALPAPDWTRPDLEEAFVAPRTPVEETLAGIWGTVLGLEQIGVYDNFFELGGHSLLATRVISRIRNTFQVELPLRCIFETPTITQLAVEIEKAKEAHGEFVPSRIEPISREVYRMKRSPAGELSDE